MRILNIRGGTSFWQWDTGRKIVIIGDEDICGEAHFCTGSGDPFPVTIRTEDGQRVAGVPDEVLQEAKPFSVYLYRKDGGGASTRYHQRFTVHPRTKPSDYIYTPTERKTWEELNQRIKALEEGGTGGGAYFAKVSVAWGGRYSFTEGSHAELLAAYNRGLTVGLNQGGTLHYLANVDGDNNLHFGQIPYSNAESAEVGITNFYLRVSPDNAITQTRRDIATEAFVREATKGSVRRFYLNITADPETGEPVAAESFDEVLSAYNEGMDIVAKITPPDDLPPVCIPLEGYYGEFIFSKDQSSYMDADLYGIRIVYGPDFLEIIDDCIGTFEGAANENDGKPGFVPMPFAGDQHKFLRGDGTWAEVPSGGGSGVNLNNYVPLFYPTVPVGEGREGDTFVHGYWESDSEKVSWTVLAISVPKDYDLSILPDFSISSGLFYPYKTGFMKREIAEETWAFFTIYSTDGTQHKVLVCHRGNFEQAKADFQAYYC